MGKPKIAGRVAPEIEPAYSKDVCFTCKTEPRNKKSAYCRECAKKHAARRKAEKAAGTYVKGRRPNIARTKDKAKYRKEYRALNHEDMKAWYRNYYKNLRNEGIAAYGGKCTCCGESDTDFLTLEHIAPVKRLKNGKRIPSGYAWMIAKKRGWPDDHTILCFNCNCAKGAYGLCPHKRAK